MAINFTYGQDGGGAIFDSVYVFYYSQLVAFTPTISFSTKFHLCIVTYFKTLT